ncbi:MAG: hypothetical protein WC475_01285 [Candidatus Paceibacterota bacterium]
MIIEDLVRKTAQSLDGRIESRIKSNPEIIGLEKEYYKKLKALNARKRKFKFLRPVIYALFTVFGAWVGAPKHGSIEERRDSKRIEYCLKTEDFQRAEKYHDKIMKDYLRDGTVRKVSEGKIYKYLRFIDPADSNRRYLRKSLRSFNKHSSTAMMCTAIAPFSAKGRDYIAVGDDHKSMRIIDLNTMNEVKGFNLQSVPRGIQREKTEEDSLSIIINSDGGKIYRMKYSDLRSNSKSLEQSLLFDAGERISEPKIIDFNGDGKNEYFFNTESGKIKGITNEGRLFFYYEKRNKSELIPVEFMNDSGLLKIISNDGKNLIAVRTDKGAGRKSEVLWTGNNPIKTNICVDGSYIAFGTSKSIVSLDLKNKEKYSKSVAEYVGELDNSEYNSTVTLADLCDYQGKEIMLTSGNRAIMFSDKCDEFYCNKFGAGAQSKPVIVDMDGDGKSEMLTNFRGNLYLTDFASTNDSRTRKIAEIKPNRRRYTYNSIAQFQRNGKTDYIVSSGEGIYSIGSALLKTRGGL